MRKTKEFLGGGRGHQIATGYFRIWELFEALLFISAFKLSKMPSRESLMWSRELLWPFKAALSRSEWQPGTRGHPFEPHHYRSKSDSVHAPGPPLHRCPRLYEMHSVCCQGLGAWPGPCQQHCFLQDAWPLHNHEKIMQRNVLLLKRPLHATQSFNEQRLGLASGFAEMLEG